MSKIITVSEDETINKSIVDVFDEVALQMGYIGDDNSYDCRKICVSTKIFEMIRDFYEKNWRHTPEQFAAIWLNIGPKTKDTLGDFEVQVEPGFIKLNLNKHLETIEKDRQALLSEIEMAFSQIPQNPDIKQCTENPPCYTISLSAISNNDYVLVPFYYNFLSQKEELSKIVSSVSSIESIMGQLIKIAETGKDKAYRRYHPTVIEYVKSVVESCA